MIPQFTLSVKPKSSELTMSDITGQADAYKGRDEARSGDIWPPRSAFHSYH